MYNFPNIPAEDAPQRNRYLRRAYLQAVVNEPWLMLRKITRQMVKGYADASKSVLNSSMRWKVLFLETDVCLSSIVLPEVPSALAKNFQQTLGEIREAKTSQPEILRAASWLPPQWVFYYVVTWFQVITLVAGAVAFLLAPWMFRRRSLRQFAVGFWGGFVVWSCTVGSALTVSIIHSFDIDRYVRLQSSVNTLLLTIGLVFFLTLVQAFLTRSVD